MTEKKHTPIPQWRMTIYSLVFTAVAGAICVRHITNPSWIMVAGSLAALVGWSYGRLNGKATGFRQAYKKWEAQFNEFKARSDAQFVQFEKDFGTALKKIERKINEGDEWKLGDGMRDPEESK